MTAEQRFGCSGSACRCSAPGVRLAQPASVLSSPRRRTTRNSQRFSREAEMPGAIRFSFDRTPDYLAALCVEGRQLRSVGLPREPDSSALVATGHRSIKPAFVNGKPAPLGYLSGLRVEPAARSGQLLARGYAFLARSTPTGRPTCT